VSIPGPSSRQLAHRREQIIPRGLSHATPVYAERAEGTKIWDVDGNEYLDFAGGIGVQNLGHRPRAVVDAISRQLQRFIHTSINVVPYELYISVAEQLAEMTPGKHPKKVLFTNSGAEAVENAVKIARSYTKRTAVVAFGHGFHGRTLLTMTLTGKVHPYRAGFGPMAPEIYHIPYPYSYRDPLADRVDYGRLAAERLFELFRTEIPPEQIAAVVVEPVTGEGGFMIPPPEFLPRLKEITEQEGILLVIDEIQTGFGRTGRLFACEHTGVIPDIMTLGKSLAAGLPLAAVVGRAEVMDAPQVGGLGGTYAGNPLALAAAQAVLDLFHDNPEILQNAQTVGELVMERFSRFRNEFPIVGDVRGLGPMAAMELVSNLVTKAPYPEAAQMVSEYAYQHGLILMRAGMEHHVIRTLMPITINREELAAGLDILEGALHYTCDNLGIPTGN